MLLKKHGENLTQLPCTITCDNESIIPFKRLD